MHTDVPNEEEGESDVKGKLSVQILAVCFREAHEDVNEDDRGGLIEDFQLLQQGFLEGLVLEQVPDLEGAHEQSAQNLHEQVIVEDNDDSCEQDPSKTEDQRVNKTRLLVPV